MGLVNSSGAVVLNGFNAASICELTSWTCLKYSRNLNSVFMIQYFVGKQISLSTVTVMPALLGNSVNGLGRDLLLLTPSGGSVVIVGNRKGDSVVLKAWVISIAEIVDVVEELVLVVGKSIMLAPYDPQKKIIHKAKEFEKFLKRDISML